MIGCLISVQATIVDRESMGLLRCNHLCILPHRDCPESIGASLLAAQGVLSVSALRAHLSAALHMLPRCLQFSVPNSILQRQCKQFHWRRWPQSMRVPEFRHHVFRASLLLVLDHAMHGVLSQNVLWYRFAGVQAFGLGSHLQSTSHPDLLSFRHQGLRLRLDNFILSHGFANPRSGSLLVPFPHYWNHKYRNFPHHCCPHTQFCKA
jgi:hypothetical protein